MNYIQYEHEVTRVLISTFECEYSVALEIIAANKEKVIAGFEHSQSPVVMAEFIFFTVAV